MVSDTEKINICAKEIKQFLNSLEGEGAIRKMVRNIIENSENINKDLDTDLCNKRFKELDTIKREEEGYFDINTEYFNVRYEWKKWNVLIR